MPSPSASLLAQMQAIHPYIGPLMTQTLSCLCEATERYPNPPQICCYRIGNEVIHDAGIYEDECCQGIAYVSFGEMYPTGEQFPEQDIIRQANSSCVPPTWGVIFKMGIIRCVPVGDQNPITCDEWTEAALQNIYDAQALARAACCVRDYVITGEPRFTGMSIVIDRQTQGNPLGGCVERYLTFTVQIPNCEC